MTDVLIVSLGSTSGLRQADEELCRALRRAGADAEIVRAKPPRPPRTLMLTDLAWARAARTAALRRLASKPARAVIYSTTTASLLWPRAGAIRFDASAAANRPGRHGLWQRPLERRRLAAAPLLLPYCDGSLRELAEQQSLRSRSLLLPVAVGPSGPATAHRDIAAITYAANPAKKGLDRVLAAWSLARRAGEELLVAGTDELELKRRGIVLPDEGVRLVGMLPSDVYRALLRRSRVFVCAPRREDYGQAQLEALADGCQLVSSEAPGPYVALGLARQLDPRLVGDDLSTALRCALDAPRHDYALRAAELLAPLGHEAIDRLVERELLPRLLGGELYAGGRALA